MKSTGIGRLLLAFCIAFAIVSCDKEKNLHKTIQEKPDYYNSDEGTQEYFLSYIEIPNSIIIDPQLHRHVRDTLSKLSPILTIRLNSSKFLNGEDEYSKSYKEFETCAQALGEKKGWKNGNTAAEGGFCRTSFNEKMFKVHVISLTDYDEKHKAGAILNDVVLISYSTFDPFFTDYVVNRKKMTQEQAKPYYWQGQKYVLQQNLAELKGISMLSVITHPYSPFFSGYYSGFDRSVHGASDYFANTISRKPHLFYLQFSHLPKTPQQKLQVSIEFPSGKKLLTPPCDVLLDEKKNPKK